MKRIKGFRYYWVNFTYNVCGFFGHSEKQLYMSGYPEVFCSRCKKYLRPSLEQTMRKMMIERKVKQRKEKSRKGVK